jgi:hypothetical protein
MAGESFGSRAMTSHDRHIRRIINPKASPAEGRAWRGPSPLAWPGRHIVIRAPIGCASRTFMKRSSIAYPSTKRREPLANSLPSRVAPGVLSTVELRRIVVEMLG